MRGAIEKVAKSYVSGWISSDARSLRGATVLAFRDKECIGAARVDAFRQDIADAKLGDGYSGFVINIVPIESADRRRIFVRLEGDDTILVPPEYHEETPGSLLPPLTRERLNECLQSVRWMRDHDWLSAAQADLLRTLLRYGVNELRIDGSGEAGTLAQARGLLATVLALIHRRDVALDVHACQDAATLAAALERHEGAENYQYVGLWSAVPNRIAVAEGSHVEHADSQAAPSLAGVNYEYGGAQVLVLDARLSVILPGVVTQTFFLRAAPHNEDAA